MKHAILPAVLAITLAAPSLTSAATFYSDRESYLANTGPQLFIDFNGVPAGSSFAGQELNVGPLNFSGGTFDGDYPVNSIVPADECRDMNGTNHVCGFVDLHNQLRLGFSEPVTSWGTDWSGLGNDGRESILRIWDDNTLLDDVYFAGNTHSQTGFMGFDIGDSLASHVTFSFLTYAPAQSSPEDIFSLDNMLVSTSRGDDPTRDPNRDPVAPVPLPPSILLLGSVGAGLFGLRKRRKA